MIHADTSVETPTSPNALWAHFDAHRLNWAFRAYERFIESLSPEIRERLAHKGTQAEAYVVVFGKTQVGKTTLLMDLMGVRPEAMDRVSRVLRGGRSQGQSATATTMEYRRSADHRWGFRFKEANTRWFDDDHAMTSELGQLREAMERRQLVVDSPCVVSIPIDYFDQQASQPAVRMLDLPGDKPANPTEQEHVHEMARKYVPLADLILLVGRGDDLSFLQPGGLTLPGIEDWQSVPGRFRIVTTYSFTAQSVRELVRQHDGPADAQLYRQRLVDQIEKFAPLSQEAKRAERYFPLEFGRSWLDAQERHPLFYKQVSPMIDALKRQLHVDIQASTTPMARLRGAVEARVVIARVKEIRSKEMHAASQAVQKQLQREQDDLAQAQNAADQSSRTCQRLAERLAMLSKERLSQDLKINFHLSGNTDGGNPNESVSNFKISVGQAKSSLRQRVIDSNPNMSNLPETDWFWRSVTAQVNLDKVDAILINVFSTLMTTLNDYWIDSYWDTGSGSDYQRDVRCLVNCIDEAVSALTDIARESWLKAANQQLFRHQEELKAEELTQRSWQQRLQDMKHPIKVLEQELAAHLHEYQAFEKRMAADLVESRRFIDVLNSEYLDELKQRHQAIDNEEQRTSGFFGLLAAVQLGQVRQQLLLHIEPAAI